MKKWQFLGYGEGFHHAKRVLGFELSGIVFAKDANEALDRAIALAKQDWPEISQAEKPEFPRLVINADEIVEVTSQLTFDEERVELIWDDQAGN